MRLFCLLLLFVNLIVYGKYSVVFLVYAQDSPTPSFASQLENGIIIVLAPVSDDRKKGNFRYLKLDRKLRNCLIFHFTSRLDGLNAVLYHRRYIVMALLTCTAVDYKLYIFS